MSCHVTSRHVLSCQMSCRVSCDVLSCYVMSCPASVKMRLRGEKRKEEGRRGQEIEEKRRERRQEEERRGEEENKRRAKRQEERVKRKTDERRETGEISSFVCGCFLVASMSIKY